jgi:hypothetical protein
MIMPTATPPPRCTAQTREPNPRRPSPRTRLFLVLLRRLVLGRTPELLAPVLALLACVTVSMHPLPRRVLSPDLHGMLWGDVRCCLLAFSILDAMPYRTSL